MSKNWDARERVMKAFIKRACGYKAKEEVRELKEVKNEDGSLKQTLVLTKVVSKDVPADLAAARWYLEGAGEEETLSLEDAKAILMQDEQE